MPRTYYGQLITLMIDPRLKKLKEFVRGTEAEILGQINEFSKVIRSYHLEEQVEDLKNKDQKTFKKNPEEYNIRFLDKLSERLERLYRIIKNNRRIKKGVTEIALEQIIEQLIFSTNEVFDSCAYVESRKRPEHSGPGGLVRKGPINPQGHSDNLSFEQAIKKYENQE